MAIFDSTRVQNLTFYIVLDDASEVERLNNLYPEGVNRAPYNPGPPEAGASIEFGAPWQGVLAGTYSADAPFSYTDWVSSTSKPFPTNVATFQRHTGGFLGIGGTTTRYYWIGKFVYQAPLETGGSDGTSPQAATPKRRFLEGFETPGRGALTGTQSDYLITDASRHTGGRGLAVRGHTNASYQLQPQSYDASFAASTEQWERLYIRLRKKPTLTVYFWRNSFTPSAGVGTLLGITADGQIAIATSSATSVITPVTTVPGVTLEEWNGLADHDVWVKLDIIFNTGGTFRLYVNGTLRSSSGGVTGTAINYSAVGAPNSGTSDLELDIDDWFGSDIPKIAAVESLTSKDWIAGSKIAALRPRTLNAATAGWTGAVQVLAQNALGFAPETLSSSTSGALLDVDTDSDEVVSQDPGSIGLVALQVVGYSLRGGAPSGSFGYKIGAAAAVDTAVTQAAALGQNQVIYSAQAGGSNVALPDATPIRLRHTKAADATAATIASLMGMVDLAGRWTKSDLTAAELADLGGDAGAAANLNYGTGPHNTPYPRTPWAKRGLSAPTSPVIVHAGTYVGNGTGQDLTFRAPVQFLWIRPTTGTYTGGTVWLSAAMASHVGHQTGNQPVVPFAEADPTFVPGDGADDVQQYRFRVRIAGSSQQVNAAGVTYQYVAWMDPGMRFSIAGSLAHPAAAVAAVNKLPVPDFTPQFLMGYAEVGTATTTKRLYLKGPGQAAATLALFAPGTLANALTFGAGQILTDAALHAVNGSFGFLAFRRSDGLQSPTEAGVVAFGSYIGDGSASRTINIAPASGRRPVFVIVFAESGATSAARDPSHTGTTSSDQSGNSLATTGITSGGVDTFSVGSALNTSTVVYGWFALFAIDGCTGNNGFGCNGENVPVETETPVGPGPWPPNPGEPAPEPGSEEGEGGGFPGGFPEAAPDFSTTCAPYSTYLANLALSRIGVSHQIANIVTEISEPAYKARLNYPLAMESVLRDYPWPFATRYADLVLVAGSEASPVNKDWTYSYRAPASMVRARRLISQEYERRSFDPDPPQFRIGSDATGYLLYSNLAASTDVPLQLEYTYRMTCPAQQGDALFREAFVWKLAGILARVIAKDTKKADDCERQYLLTLPAAKEVAANEEQKDNEGGDAPWIRAR